MSEESEAYEGTIEALRSESDWQWIPAGALVERERLACIDGRHEECVVGAPGGSSGEFVLLLAAVENEGGVVIDDQQVEALLGSYMDRHGAFYMHTDEHALEALQRGLDDRLESPATFPEANSFEEWLRQPPEDVRETLLEELVDPEHVGCGHLKTMLQYPGEFQLRRGLVESIIRAFFLAMWEGRPEADFVVLRGEHEETAVVTVEMDREVDAETEVPSICMGGDAPSVFVNHVDVRRWVWGEDLEFLEHDVDIPGIELEEREALLDVIEQLSNVQLEATVGHLAPELPHYRLRF